VKLENVDYDIFLALVTGIYTDHVEINAKNLQGLIKLSTKYQVDKVRGMCASFMDDDITAENVLELFEIAPSMLGDKEFGLQFIEENADEVLSSPGIENLSRERFLTILQDDKLQVEEVEVFKALLRWAEAEAKRTQGDKKTIGKELALKYVRFPTMEMAHIATVVGPSGYLEQPQLVSLYGYLSVTDENVRALMPDLGFPKTPRSGGGVAWSWSNTKKGHNITLSNNNLTATAGGTAWAYNVVCGTKEFKNGNHYWEVNLDNSTDDMIGVASPSINADSTSAYSNLGSQCWFVHHSSGSYGGTVGTKVQMNSESKTGDVLGFYLQHNKTKNTFDLTVYKNRKLVGTPFKNIPSPVVAATELYGTPAKVTLIPNARKPS